MTYILAYSVTGIYDVTRRYIKNWELVEKRRKNADVGNLERMLKVKNGSLRERHLDIIEIINIRDELEKLDLTNKNNKV